MVQDDRIGKCMYVVRGCASFVVVDYCDTDLTLAYKDALLFLYKPFDYILDFPGVIEKSRQFAFPDVPQSFLDAYRSIRNQRVSLENLTTETTLAANSPFGDYDLSIFNRGMLSGSSEEITLTEWKLEESRLDRVLLKRLFRGKQAKLEAFVCEIVPLVKLFRAICYQYATMPATLGMLPRVIGQNANHIDEVKYFQPLFEIFLEHVLLELHQYNRTHKVHLTGANRTILSREVYFGDALRAFCGTTDIAISGKDAAADPDEWISMIELKSPFKQLFHSAGNSRKEQLIGQLFAMTQKRTSMIGGLTDLFTIVLVLANNNNSYNMTKTVVDEPNLYIKYLLLLCFELDEDDLTELTKDAIGEVIDLFPEIDSAAPDVVANSPANVNGPAGVGFQSKLGHNTRISTRKKTHDEYMEDLEELHNIRMRRMPEGTLTSELLSRMSSFV